MEIHGEKDRIIKYSGNRKRGFPSAKESVTPWALNNHCQTNRSLQLNAEANILEFGQCDQNKSVGLWSLKNGKHNNFLGGVLTFKILNYLF